MKKLLAIVLVALIAMSAFACAVPAESPSATEAPAPAATEAPATEAPASTDSVKIGAISPNTGDLAAYGEAVSNGIKLAVEEINAKGGVLGGRQLEVIAYMDDKGDSTEGANAYAKLVSDGVSAIIGSVTSGVTAGLATLADKDKMLLITPTATNDSITVDKSTVFRACYKDSYQGEVCAKVAKDLGLTKVAVLYASGDPYSSGLKDAFMSAVEANGLTVVATESSSGVHDTDYTSQLTNIIASGAEMIFAPYYYDTIGPYIVPQARQLGYTGAFSGADGWDGTIGTMQDDKSLYNNCYFTNHYAQDNPSEKVQSFVKDYSAKFDPKTLNALAALAYDATYMLAASIDKAGTDVTADIVTAMTGMSFDGVTGSFTLDSGNNPAKACSIIEFKDGEAVFYKEIG